MSTIALENDVRSFAARYAQPNISGFWEAAVHKDARSAEHLGLATSALRSVKLFARFGEGQIRSFLRYLEEVQVPSLVTWSARDNAVTPCMWYWKENSAL
jgi:hypothetical protein